MKENWTNTGRICRRRLVITIQKVVINIHTKNDHSSLHGCGEIFAKNFILQSMDGKKIGTNSGMNKQKKAGSQSHDATSRHQPAYQI